MNVETFWFDTSTWLRRWRGTENSNESAAA